MNQVAKRGSSWLAYFQIESWPQSSHYQSWGRLELQVAFCCLYVWRVENKKTLDMKSKRWSFDMSRVR